MFVDCNERSVYVFYLCKTICCSGPVYISINLAKNRNIKIFVLKCYFHFFMDTIFNDIQSCFCRVKMFPKESELILRISFLNGEIRMKQLVFESNLKRPLKVPAYISFCFEMNRHLTYWYCFVLCFEILNPMFLK